MVSVNLADSEQSWSEAIYNTGKELTYDNAMGVLKTGCDLVDDIYKVTKEGHDDLIDKLDEATDSPKDALRVLSEPDRKPLELEDGRTIRLGQDIGSGTFKSVFEHADPDKVVQVIDTPQAAMAGRALQRETISAARLDRAGVDRAKIYETVIGKDGRLAKVVDQRVIRISEWRTRAGTIRLGFPRRLDQQVRIEVQHAADFPPLRNTLWSIEEVR